MRQPAPPSLRPGRPCCVHAEQLESRRLLAAGFQIDLSFVFPLSKPEYASFREPFIRAKERWERIRARVRGSRS